MKQIKFTLSGADGKNIGSFTVPEKFITETKRLRVAPGLILSEFAREFAEFPPDSIAVPRAMAVAISAELAAA